MDVKLAFGELIRLNRQMLVKIDENTSGCSFCGSFDQESCADGQIRINHKDNCLAVQVCNLINLIDVAQGFSPPQEAGIAKGDE